MPQEYMSKLADQMDTVQSNTKSKKSSATTKPASSTENLMIIKTLAAGANHPANKATRFLEGAVLTITDPHLAVDSTKFPDTEFRKPTTYKRKITKVVNGTNVVMPPYKITRISDGQQRAVPLNDFTFSITYEKTIVKPNISGVFKKSYADIQFSNLQTFSGDVYKAKIFTKEKGSQGDFEKIGEIVLDGQNQLVNPEGATGFETIGIYHTQSIIEDGWVTSSVLSSATQGEDDIAASVTLSGSNGAHASDFTFVTKNSYGLQRNEDYIVSFDTYFNKSNKSDKDGNVSETAELEVFLTGSINSPTASEVSLGTLDNTFEGMKGRNQGYIPGIFNYFKTHNKAVVQPEAKLGFRVKSGNFKLANVALTPYFEKNFNPVSFRTLLPMPKPVKRGQRFDFYTEFYDFNNNKAGFLAETSASIVFDGAPQVLADGTDGLLTGSVFLGNVTSSGIELHGGSAYIRSLGYDGFNDTISSNLGGFLIFSGSVSESIGTTEDYEGVGLEIVDAHGSTDRFLKFRTNPSEFTVQTDQFFFGKEGQFISGSNGNIVISSSNFFLGGESTFVSGSNDKLEISSSNFHLDNDGSVIMAGTITAEAGGTIGGFNIGSSALSVGTGANFVSLDSSNKKLRIGAKASLTDSNTGVHVGTDGIALGANSVFKVTNAGAVSAGNITATGGTIGGFTITDSKIESSDFVSGLKGVRISTEQNGLIEAENAKIRGTLATTTFEKETVNAVGGQLHVANATMITGSSMGINDLSASIANVSGFTAGEVIIAKKVSGTGFNTEYMRVHSSSRLSTDDNNQSGLLFVTRSFSGSTHFATGSEGFRGEAFGNSSSYEPGQVLVSTGVSGSGYIRLNANPRDLATPYIDIVERTGSGVYDTQLKARLGDLSGLSRNVIGTSTPGFGLFSENVFLTGTISASAGSIGGISLDSDKLFSGAGNHGQSDTAFFLQGGTAATKGDFSLGDKFVWDSSESTLNIDGTITIGSISGLAASTASVDSLTSRVIITNNDVTVAHNSGHNKGIFNAAGLTVIGNNQTGSVFGDFGAEIYGASDKNERLTISSNGVSLIANNITGSVITSAGTTIFGASDKKERLDVNADGLTLIANNITGSFVDANGMEIYGASDKQEKALINADGMTIVAGNVTASKFGTDVIIGEVGSSKSNVQITSGAINLRNNTSNKMVLAANGTMTIGNNISLTAAGDATFNGTVQVGGTSLTTGNTLNTNTTATDVGLGNVDNQSAATIQSNTLSAADADDVGLGNVENKNSQTQAQDGLTSGVTLTGGGITIGSAGSIKSDGKDSISDTTAGFFLGRAGTSYDFAVGDSSRNIKFDGSAGTLTVLGNLQIAGTGTELTDANTFNADFPADKDLDLHIPCMHRPGTTSTGDGNGADKLDKFGVEKDDVVLGTPGIAASIGDNDKGLAEATGVDGRPNGSIRVVGATGNTKFLTVSPVDDMRSDGQLRASQAIGISFWCRLTNMNSDNRTLAIGQWQSSNTMGYEGFSEFQINSGNLELIGETNTNGDVFTISLGSYTHDASDWHHIVLTQGTDNVVHAYRNGILREDCTELANTWTVNVFGTGYIDANGSLNASTPGTTDFAEIRYYNKELTQTEITALYQNPFGVDSKGLTEGNMGGWTIASDAIHSGTKVADTIPAAAGAITIGSSGYIGAQKFQLTTAGNAIFSGSISIADATMGQLTQSRGFDDFFQVEGGIDGGFRLQAKATAFAGGATFQEFGSAIGTASAGTSVLCVLKGTKVITQRGEINIEDTKESDLIKVYDWFTKEWGYSPIDKILNRVTKEGWSHIKTKKGYELKCSNSHLLYHPDYPKCAIAADKLGVGGQLYIVENDKIVEDYIESIEVYDEPVEVWNYELKLTHNYISNGILSHNGLPKEPFTAPHLHIKRNDVEIETGDLVKLDDNNELVKVSDSKDTSVIGILWQKVEILQEQISLLNKMKEVAGEESVDLTNELYRDSLNNLIPENERDSKSLWAVAAIGDTRDYDSNLNGMKICNQNGEVKMGDLICSSDNSGYAMRQSDEYVVVGFDCDVDSSLDRPIYEKRQNLCSHTIGKVMQDVEFDENGNAENVYAYLYCG